MKSGEIKEAFNKLNPPADFQLKTVPTFITNKNSFITIRKKQIMIAACLLLFSVLSVFIAQYNYSGAIYIPKTDVNSESFELTNTLPTIIYQGKGYVAINNIWEKSTELSNLKGQYLGKTNTDLVNMIFQGQRKPYKNLDATHAFDVYTVKGYDLNFRILAVGADGCYTIFENLEGFWVRNGGDILQKYNVDENVVKAEFRYDLWSDTNESEWVNVNIDNMALIDQFIDEFSKTEPIYDEILGMETYKVFGTLVLTMRDHTLLALNLVEGNYIETNIYGLRFQIDGALFNQIINVIHP